MTPLPSLTAAVTARANTAAGLACVACGGEVEFAWRASNRQGQRDWAFHRCASCGALRLDDRELGDEEADQTGVMSDDDGSYGDDARGTFAELQRRLQSRLLAPEVDVVARALPPTTGPRLLEVGCGAGLLAQEVRARRPDVRYHGIEPRPEAARIAGGRGVDILGSSLTALVEPLPFDAIVMIHVLEHVASPIETLRALHARLAPRGTLVISVPVADSWEARLFGRRWYGLFPPHHRWLPTVQALHRVVGDAGFEVTMTSWRSYRTPLVGTVSSVAPFLEPARLRALARRAPLLALCGQAALAAGLVMALPPTLLANAARRGSSVTVMARARGGEA